MSPTKHAGGPSVKDLRDDDGELFSRIFNSQGSLPNSLRKRAHLIDEIEVSRLPDSSFADPFARKFLVNTPEHTITSFAYLFAQGVGNDDFRIDTCRKMASFFGINSEILDVERELIKRLSSTSSKVAAPKDWSIRVDAVVDGATKVAGVSGSGEDSLIDAANRIRSIEFAKEMAPELISGMASQVLKVASTNEWGLGSPGDVSDLMLLAGRACSDRELVEASIFSRSSFFPEKHRDSISNTARKMASAPQLPDGGGLLEIAFHLGKIDRELGINEFYGIRVPDPLRSVFHHSEAYAKKVASIFRVGAGTEYHRYQVEMPAFKVAAEMIADLHGLDRSSVPSSPEGIPSWIPPELESPFRKIASDLGIVPRRAV